MDLDGGSFVDVHLPGQGKVLKCVSGQGKRIHTINGGGLYFRSVEAPVQERELCPKPLQFQHVIWVDGIRSFLGRPWKAAAAMCSFSSGEMLESDIWLETWYLMISVWNEAKSGQAELWKENLKPRKLKRTCRDSNPAPSSVQ